MYLIYSRLKYWLGKMFKAVHAASIEFWIISRIICADSGTEKEYRTTTGIGKCICGIGSIVVRILKSACQFNSLQLYRHNIYDIHWLFLRISAGTPQYRPCASNLPMNTGVKKCRGSHASPRSLQIYYLLAKNDQMYINASQNLYQVAQLCKWTDTSLRGVTNLAPWRLCRICHESEFPVHTNSQKHWTHANVCICAICIKFSGGKSTVFLEGCHSALNNFLTLISRKEIAVSLNWNDKNIKCQNDLG